MTTQDLMDRMTAGLDSLLDSDSFCQWLAVQARFHQYSFGNALLIAIQYPQATRVAGFHAWKRLGRSVKQGEKGIAIFAPVQYKAPSKDADALPDEERVRVGFRAVYVFDVSQTDGEPLPTLYTPDADDTNPVSAPLTERLLQLAADEGLTVNRAATDCAAAKGFYGYYIWQAHRIHVAADCTPNQGAATLAHELGHHLLGHVATVTIPGPSGKCRREVSPTWSAWRRA